MFGVLVKRARAIKDFLVLFVIVALGMRLTNGGDDVVWPEVVILAILGSFCSIMAAITMVTTVVEATVIVASVVEAVVVAVRWAMSACILVEAHLGFLGIGVLVGGSYHFADTSGRLAVEFGAKLAMVESSDKGGDDFSFHDVGNRVPHLKEMSDVATEELGWLLVDAVQIMLGAWSSTRSHVVVGEDLFQLFPGSNGVQGKACEPVHCSWRKHDGKIVCHDVGISPDGMHSNGISL